MKQPLFTKNFTLLILGQVSSLFGNTILKFALSMYILETTGSAAIFGGILSLATIPTILLSPLGGILADRANRRTIMVALDTLSGLGILCFALFSRQGGTAGVALLLVWLSILGAFESPTVQACVPQMQSGDNLLRGNAVVNQVSAVAGLVAPILGSLLYTVLGLGPVLAAAIACFFLTALLECFIRLTYIPQDGLRGVRAIVKNDFMQGMRFIFKEQPDILRLLLLAALANFFVVSCAAVGLPYIVRTVLGLGAEYYGAAESAMGFSAILGSVAAGFLARRLKTRRLALVLAVVGAPLLPAGIIFLLPASAGVQYAVILAAFCAVQAATCIFSIFGLSLIQQKTPPHLSGKVMAYVYTITLCAQPLGQTLYGFMFDGLQGASAFILLATGAALCLAGGLSAGFFKRLETSPLGEGGTEPCARDK